MSNDNKSNFSFPEDLGGKAASLRMLAKFILDCNRRRADFLPEIQWGERAWDLILEMYILSARQRFFCYDEIQKNPNISPSIDKRYFSWLEDEGLLEKSRYEGNQFLVQYRLSNKANAEIEGWLMECLNSGTGFES